MMPINQHHPPTNGIRVVQVSVLRPDATEPTKIPVTLAQSFSLVDVAQIIMTSIDPSGKTQAKTHQLLEVDRSGQYVPLSRVEQIQDGSMLVVLRRFGFAGPAPPLPPASATASPPLAGPHHEAAPTPPAEQMAPPPPAPPQVRPPSAAPPPAPPAPPASNAVSLPQFVPPENSASPAGARWLPPPPPQPASTAELRPAVSLRQFVAPRNNAHCQAPPPPTPPHATQPQALVEASLDAPHSDTLNGDQQQYCGKPYASRHHNAEVGVEELPHNSRTTCRRCDEEYDGAPDDHNRVCKNPIKVPCKFRCGTGLLMGSDFSVHHAVCPNNPEKQPTADELHELESRRVEVVPTSETVENSMVDAKKPPPPPLPANHEDDMFSDGWCVLGESLAPPATRTPSTSGSSLTKDRPVTSHVNSKELPVVADVLQPCSAADVPPNAKLFSGYCRHSQQHMVSLRQFAVLPNATTKGDVAGNEALSSCFIKLNAHWNKRRTSAFHCQPRRPCSEAQLRGYQELELDPEYCQAYSSDLRHRRNTTTCARTVQLQFIPLAAHPKSVLAYFSSCGPVMRLRITYKKQEDVCHLKQPHYFAICEYADISSATLFKRTAGSRVAAGLYLRAETSKAPISYPHRDDGSIHYNSASKAFHIQSLGSLPPPQRYKDLPDEALDLVRCVWYWEVMEAIKSEIFEFLKESFVLSDTMNYATTSRFPTIFRAIRHIHAGSAQLCDGKRCQTGRQSLPQSIARFLLRNSEPHRDVAGSRRYNRPQKKVISDFIVGYLEETRPRCLPNDFFLYREDGDATPITPGAMVLATVPSEPFCALGSEWVDV